MKCAVFVLLDEDAEGILARDKAIQQGTLKIVQTNTINWKGLKQAEMEDVFDVSHYRQELKDEYGVDLARAEFKIPSKKWSDRVADCFKAASKPWGEKIEAEVKLFVANLLARKIENGVDVLHAHRGQPLAELITALEARYP